MQTLSERIRLVRKQNKLSQVKFAKILGVDGTYISKIETGKANPSKTLIFFICISFGISRSWLNTGEGPMEAEWGSTGLREAEKVFAITPELRNYFTLLDGFIEKAERLFKNFTEIDEAVLSVLHAIDEASLKDFYLFLASKANRLEKGERDELSKDIAILRKASK